MIDFRYHVVSIVAVFLALTVGLVIGSSYLSQVAYDTLNSQLAGLRSENQALHEGQSQLQAQMRERESLITALGPAAVAGKLTGRAVAVVVLPGADRSVGDATAEMLVKAGATVPGELYLGSALVDPAQTSKVAKLADSSALIWSFSGPSESSAASPATAAAPVRALADLATALSRKAAPQPGAGSTLATKVTDTQALAVLAGYTNSGFVSTRSTFADPADMVVVIGPPPPSTGPAADLNNGYYLGFVKDLDPLTGVVIAGPAASATAPGLIAAAVKDAWAAKNTSTVDSIDLSAGRVITVFALAEELTQKTGHYGLSGTADGPLPILG